VQAGFPAMAFTDLKRLIASAISGRPISTKPTSSAPASKQSRRSQAASTEVAPD
jgi:hypothetical protein